MKVLITGAAGFIGSHVARRLADLGHAVIGADNFSPYYPRELKLANVKPFKEKGIELFTCDLSIPSDYAGLPRDLDYIFHLAAQPGISKNSSFEDYTINNIYATRHLISFAETCRNLKLFVNISTSSVYGRDASRDETAAPQPISIYGVTKLAAEQLVLAHSRNGIFNACSLRLYSVYGPGERPDKLFTRLIRCALTGEPFPLYSGSLEHSRSFTFVSDITEGIVAVVGKEAALNNEIINLGSETEHTTREGIDTVEALLGIKILKDLLPARDGDQSRTKAVTGKAARLLNYNPQTPLVVGVEQQIEWLKKLDQELSYKNSHNL